jgi:electron transport complex protein RnfB
MQPVTEGKTGWDAWSQEQANSARQQFEFRTMRLAREKRENDERLAAKAAAKLKALELEPALSEEEIRSKERKKAVIAAAMERARLKKLQQKRSKINHECRKTACHFYASAKRKPASNNRT